MQVALPTIAPAQRGAARQIVAKLRGTQTVTIIEGSRGKGKSVLAQAALHYFYNVASSWAIGDPVDLTSDTQIPLAGRIARSFKVERINTDIQLAAYFEPRRALITLVHCNEAAAEDVTRLVLTLGKQCAGLRFLVATSTRLDIPGAERLEMSALVPESAMDIAIQLLAGRFDGGLPKEAPGGPLEGIVARTGNNPRALRLVLGMAGPVSLATIAETAKISGLADHASEEGLHTAIVRWAYDALYRVKRVFARLSIFRELSRNAAQAACVGELAPAEMVEPLIDTLLWKRWLSLEEPFGTSMRAHRERYRVDKETADLVSVTLTQDEVRSARDAHIGYVRSWAERSDTVPSEEIMSAGYVLTNEWDAAPKACRDLAIAAATPFRLLGRLREVRTYLERALQAPVPFAAPLQEARLRLELGRIDLAERHYEAASTSLREAHAAAGRAAGEARSDGEQLRARRVQASARIAEGRLAQLLAKLDTAREAYDDAVRHEAGDESAAEAHVGLAWVALEEDDIGGAAGHCGEAARHRAEAERRLERPMDRRHLAETRRIQGWVEIHRNRAKEALECFEDSREHYEQIEVLEDRDFSLDGIGFAQLRLGNTEPARKAFEMARGIREWLNVPRRRLDSCSNLLYHAIVLYRASAAPQRYDLELLLERGEGVARTLPTDTSASDDGVLGWWETVRGMALYAVDNPEGGLKACRVSLDHYSRRHFRPRWLVATALEALSDVHDALGDHEAAARALGAATGCRATIGIPPPANRKGARSSPRADLKIRHPASFKSGERLAAGDGAGW